MEKDKVCKYESKKVGTAILKSEKVDFKAKKITKGEEDTS